VERRRSPLILLFRPPDRKEYFAGKNDEFSSFARVLALKIYMNRCREVPASSSKGENGVETPFSAFF